MKGRLRDARGARLQDYDEQDELPPCRVCGSHGCETWIEQLTRPPLGYDATEKLGSEDGKTVP